MRNDMDFGLWNFEVETSCPVIVLDRDLVVTLRLEILFEMLDTRACVLLGV